MAFTLRNALKKQKGGMIGVTIDGKQKWFEEDDFMELFEKEGTKEVLVDAIKHGRDPKKETEVPDMKPKADISETREREYDESESREVFDKNIAEIPPKPTDKQLAGVEKTPHQKIESKATTDPYSRKDEYEPITPKNFPVFEKRTRDILKQKLRKFDFLKTLHPKDAAQRKIAEMEEGWFDEFSQSQGRPGMSFELLDDYKKDPDMRRFIYDLDRELTRNKEAIYDVTNKKFSEAKRQRDELILHIENQLDTKRDEMNEIVKAQEEEAEKYTEENRVKDMKTRVKVLRNLADANQAQDKEAVEAYTAELKLLEDRLGTTGTTEKEELQESPTGLKNEDKMRAHLKSRGYDDEQIESTLKAYAARKG